MGTGGDHIHLFVAVAPKYTPYRVIQILKGIVQEKIKKIPPLGG